MSKKTTVTMPAIPTSTPKSIGEFATFLLNLGKLERVDCKTWEKIPGCYQINYNGRVLGAFYLSEKTGTYRILTSSKFFKTIPSNGKIIKNGLDLYVSKCTNIKSGIDFIRNSCHQFVDKANGKAVVLYDKDNFITPKEEPAEEPVSDKVVVTEG